MEYLTYKQVWELVYACRKVFKRKFTIRRNESLILVSFRHGLRPTEAAMLRWSDIDFKSSRIFVRRIKGSRDCHHPLQGDTTRTLKAYRREGGDKSEFVFCTSTGTPISRHTTKAVLGQLCNYLGWKRVYPHILRHSCGYHLANQGLDTRLIQDYLGHQEIQHTVVYTKINPERFKNINW